MSGEITVALIALGGMVISVLASLFISMRQTSAELSKMRTEIRQTYADKLLEKRIEIYPGLYKLLSEFTKEIKEARKISRARLAELETQITDWDVSNAVFLSGKAFELSYRFRKLVIELMNQSTEEFDDSAILLDLRGKADGVKLALKEDLGIFVVEFPEADVAFESFRDVANAATDSPQ